MARGAGAPILAPDRIQGAVFNGQKEIHSGYHGYRCYESSR